MQKSDNKTRVFGIVVLYGFETKNFFGSGLYEKLSAKYKTVVLRRNFPTNNFSEYVEKYGLNVVELDQKMAKKRLKSEELFLASRRARQRLKNVENFNYFKSDRPKRMSDYILGHWCVNKTLGLYVKLKNIRYYHDKKLEEIYDDQEITDLLIAGYSSSESIVLANTAIQTKRNVWLVINSWKDFYVNNLIPFAPTKTFVWSQQMKEQILVSNGHIEADDIVVSGNPSFDRFFEYKPFHTKAYYSDKYCFDQSRPLILYSMISPQAYEDEKESIELISKKLTATYHDEKQRPIIVLRRNPIDEISVVDSYFSGNNIRYADNYFEGSYEHAVFVQLHEGEIEWMDFLYHADININIASTVTLEALMMKTPVINIEFGGKGNCDERLKRYAGAPFYMALHNREDIVIAPTIDICIAGIKKFLSSTAIIEDAMPILDRFDNKSTKKINEQIMESESICI